MNACQADISNRFLEYKEQVKNTISSHENEIFNLLSKKANLTDIHKALKNKINSEDLTRLIQKKAGVTDIVELEQRINKAVAFID